MTLEVKVPELNDDQCKAIFREAMNRELVKTVDGSFPEDINVIRKDANDLVEAAIRASNAGNKSQNVATLLFMGQVDMKPNLSEQESPQAEPVNSTGIDLTTVSNIVLDGLIDGLDKYVETPTIEQQRQAFLAEKKRRANAGQDLPSSQEAPQELSTASQGAPKQLSDRGKESEMVSSVHQVVEQDGSSRQSSSDLEPTTGLGSDIEQVAEDAGSFAGVQATQQVQEGSSNASQSSEKNTTLDFFRNQLNFDIVKAHDVDITKIDKLSKNQLEFMIANPAGPDSAQTTIDEPKDNNDMSDPSSEKSVQGVIEQAVVEPQLVSKSDLGIEEDKAAESPKSISLDRENLESQITGPMLKAAGRGRKEIPSMSDTELQLLLAPPKSKKVVVKEPTMETVEINKEPSEVIKKFDADLDIVNKDVEREISDPEDSVSLGQSAKNSIDKSDLTVDTKAEKELIENKEDDFVYTEEKSSKVNKALDIINRENLPIAPEIEGEPPRLPNDVSKVSRDELFSLHARFHAVESRTNWIVSNFEDELGDIVKLRTAREVVVANDIPLNIDEKRVTNEQRDIMVAADKNVMKFLDQEHEVKKVINKLKVLQKNYFKDCERLSRQMSKYEREKNDGPR